MAGKGKVDNLKPFKKGKGENRDPRINTNGRPKGFDELRKLAQRIASEEATANGRPIIIDNQKQTQVTMLMRDLMRSNPVAFLQYAYGKPKEEILIDWREQLPPGLDPDEVQRQFVQLMAQAAQGTDDTNND